MLVLLALFVCQAREEADSRPKRPIQRKLVKTTEEGNSCLVSVNQIDLGPR